MSNDKEKTAVLLVSVYTLISAILIAPDWADVGIAKGATITQRLIYHLFHTSVIHAAVNVWCLLSIMFIYRPSWHRLLAAYIIAAAAPDIALSQTPTVGLSAVCYALLGSFAFQAERRLYYNAYMALYLTIGFIMPLVNGWLHLYSYSAGTILGLLTMPIPCRK